jgi:hypothetical protein
VFDNLLEPRDDFRVGHIRRVFLEIQTNRGDHFARPIHMIDQAIPAALTESPLDAKPNFEYVWANPRYSVASAGEWFLEAQTLESDLERGEIA